MTIVGNTPNYQNVFGGATVPATGFPYQSLTITADTQLAWPYNYAGQANVTSKIMDVTCASGNSLLMPPANQVSIGEDCLIRNIGANTLLVKDSTGVQIASLAPGYADYIYVTNNSTAAGTWGLINFGVGSASIDAAALVGYGIIASGSSLNAAHPTTSQSTTFNIDATYRAKLINYTGGVATVTLSAAATLGDNFFTLFHNSGTGTVTLDPNGAETIDASATFTVQPGESLILICSGAAFFTVGYGRSTVYQFTQLVLDVSAAGTFTLSSAQASNKLLTFTGNPAGAVTVIVPNTVAVYYVLSSISTAQTITMKTAAGTGIGISQSTRLVAICDSTNVYAAASPTVGNSTVSLIDGSAGSPSLNFSSSTNTGLYKDATPGIGFSVSGTNRASLTASSFTVQVAGSFPSMTIGSLAGLLKGTAGAVSAAVAGTDYLAPPAGTALLKANSGGALANAVVRTDYAEPTTALATGLLKNTTGTGAHSIAVAGIDYAAATSGSAILKGNGSGGFSAAVAGIDYAAATSGSAILKGNGSGGFSAAVAGTDYISPTGTESLSNKTLDPITVTVNGFTIGYRGVPASTNTTIAAADAGKCLEVSSTVTIPNSVMSAGDVVSIFNNSAASITLTASIATLYQAGTANTGNRTLAQRGLATIRFISGTVAVISGAGLS